MTFGIPSSTWICDAIRVTWGAHARTHTHTEACAATPLPTVPSASQRQATQPSCVPDPPGSGRLGFQPHHSYLQNLGQGPSAPGSLGLLISGMIGLARYPEPSLLRHSRQGM